MKEIDGGHRFIRGKIVIHLIDLEHVRLEKLQAAVQPEGVDSLRGLADHGGRMIDPETAEIGMAFAKVSGELRGLTTEINDGTNLLPQENFLHHGKQKASSEPGKSFGDLGFTAEEVISEKRFLLELSPEGGKNGFVCMEKLKDSGGIFPKLFSSAVPGNFFPFHVKNSNSNKIPAKRMKDFRIQVPLSGEGFDGNG